MLHVLARNWWALLIRGIAAIAFGILAFAWPVSTIFAIVVIFGAYAFVDGVFAIAAALRAAAAHERWWPFLLEGIVGIIIAAVVFFEPHRAAFALYITIAVWAFVTGIFEIVAGVHMRRHIANEFWMLIGGICSILFGILLVFNPIIGALTLIWIIGAYAIVFGILMLIFALRLRRHVPTGTVSAHS